MLAFLVACPAAFALGWLLLTLELGPWRKTAGAHWALRARALHPARIAGGVNSWVLPVVLALASGMIWPGHFFPTLAGGFLGAQLSGYALVQASLPQVAWPRWLRLLAGSLVFGLLRWGTVAAAIFLMPVEMNATAWGLALGVLVVHVALHFGLAVRVQAALGLLRPASPRLREIVEQVRAAQGGRVRAVWEMTTPEANAYAFIATRELAFTSGLIEAAPDEELRAICAHELAHLAESRAAMVVRIVGGLAIFPLIFLAPVHARFGPGGILALALGAWAVWWLHARYYRAQEKHADRSAAHATPDSEAYARGLERIYRLNHWPVAQARSSFNPYPDLYDRMLAAGVTPDYPKPPPPRPRAWSSNLLLLLAAGLWLRLLLAGG
jgi:Zn-dependent protease with chaperone function